MTIATKVTLANFTQAFIDPDLGAAIDILRINRSSAVDSLVRVLNEMPSEYFTQRDLLSRIQSFTAGIDKLSSVQSTLEFVEDLGGGS